MRANPARRRSPVDQKPGEVEIARRDEFTLYHRPHNGRAPWVSLRVTRNAPTGRRSFWLGACPERMALHVDWVVLSRRHPTAAAWVEEVARGLAATINREAAE
jgi:hypothetical protein